MEEKADVDLETTFIDLSSPGNDKNTKTIEKDIVTTKTNLVSFPQLFGYADKSDLLLIWIGILAGCITGILQPLQIIVFGDVINAFNSVETDIDAFQSAISTVSLRFIYLGIIVFISGFLQVACFTISSDRQIRRIRTAYVQSLLRQEISWFDQEKPMEMASKVATATFKIHDGIGRKAGDGFNFFSMAVGGIIIGIIKGWELALALLAFTPVIAFTAYLMMKTLGDAVSAGNDAYTKAGGIAEEALSNIRTVHSFNAGKAVAEKYSASLEPAEASGIKKSISVGVGTGGMFFTIFCTYAFAMYYGTVLVSNDQLGPLEDRCTGDDCYDGGRILIVFFSVIMGAMALGQAGPSIQAIVAARASAYDVFAVINRKSAIDSDTDAGETVDDIKGHLIFKDVNFAYPSRPDTKVCINYNLEIQPGETIALVGSSGCGKSTSVSLLERYYDPSSGSVLLDGHNLKDLNVKFLRSQIGLVGQEPALFRTTIGKNIALGKQDGVATLEEIHDAARKANAYDFIMSMPDGFETEVGEKGTQLSGGQKQRIAIARAIIKQPKILLLDEATSALDTESERVVQASLDALLAQSQRTTIIIAHRLSTIRNVNRIAVIKDGNVAEIGSHDELMKLPEGLYKALVDAQGSAKLEEDSLVVQAETVKARELSSTKSASFKNMEESEKDEEEKPEELYHVPLSRLWNLVRPELKYTVMGTFGAAVNGSVFPIWGLLLTKIVVMFFRTDLNVDDFRSEGSKWSIAFALLGVAFAVSIAMQYYGFAVVTEKMTKRLRHQTFYAMIRQEIAWFDEKDHSSGALTTRLATDTATIQALTVEVLNRNVVTFFTLGVAFGIAFYYSWQMTLVLIAAFPVLMFGSYIQMQTMGGTASTVTGAGNDGHTKAGALLSETVVNMRTVSAFNMETYMRNEYLVFLSEAKAKETKDGLYSGVGFGLSQGLLFAVQGLLFYVGGILVADGDITFEEMFVVFLSIMFSSFGIGMAAQVMTDSYKAKKAASSIFSIIDRVTAIDSSSESGEKLSAVKGDLTFTNVEFVYPTRPEASIYKSYSLTVESGQTVALVGASGGGKSTSIALLERFYDPLNGEILLDGKNIKDLNIQWLREQFSLVSQEPVLFSGTISDNIRYGKPNANDSEIEEAAKMANAYDFISQFPLGFNTSVGDNGIQVSGGQKQRIALARAIIRDPPVLLLDEATSALDSESERIVQESLDTLLQSKKRTTIVIAHRLSTIRNADKIAVVKEGVIVEEGKHDDLMAKKGVYASLVERQVGST